MKNDHIQINNQNPKCYIFSKKNFEVKNNKLKMVIPRKCFRVLRQGLSI